MMEGLGLKGARRAAGRGVAEGPNPPAAVPNPPSCAPLSPAALGTPAALPGRMSRPCLDHSAAIGQPGA